MLACNCNISKQSGKWLHKIRKKVALAARKNAKKLFLLRCCYCGAKILFVPQKERVKALSEASLDRSYFTQIVITSPKETPPAQVKSMATVSSLAVPNLKSIEP